MAHRSVAGVSLLLIGIAVVVAAWQTTGLVIHYMAWSTRPRVGSAVMSHMADVIYSEPAANGLLRVLFPKTVHPPGASRLLHEPEILRNWKSLEDTYALYDDGSVPPGSGPPAPVQFNVPPIESFWVTYAENAEKAAVFLSSPAFIGLRGVARELALARCRCDTLLEKVLLQRDVYHVFSIVDRANCTSPDAALAAGADFVACDLAEALRALLFSREELRVLQAEYATHVGAVEFKLGPGADYSPEDEYLPRRVATEDSTWYPMETRLSEHVHFKRFRGRSFFHTWIRVPGMTQEEFGDYWHNIARSYGSISNTVRLLSPLPAGTETLMTRTLAVLIEDGTVEDSGIVEEVLIRVHKSEKADFDSATSDFRGTNHWQFLLDRERLLKGRSPIGLALIDQDAPAYVGIFPRAPDWGSAFNENVTLARFNCIACHSESLHGASTIFALGQEQQYDREQVFWAPEYIRPNPDGPGFVLTTTEFRHLNAILRRRRHDDNDP